jgi:hypothetical protein
MNVDANTASEANWEKLFQEIAEEPEIDEEGYIYTMGVNLSDSQAELYDFADEIIMLRMQERLVERLHKNADWIGHLEFGNKFFMAMDEQQQQSFFHGIFILPSKSILVGEATDDTMESPAITICTSALLETLPQLNEDVWHLSVSNFKLTCQLDADVLSNIISSKRGSLQTLVLESIKCPVDESNKEDSNEPDGFLDPLFYAAASDLCAFLYQLKHILSS